MDKRRVRKNGKRALRLERLDPRVCMAADLGMLASPWCNHSIPQDVNQDSAVSPLDALLVINTLNSRGAGPLIAEGEASGITAKVDVNGDLQITALDVLSVVNRLNQPADSAVTEPTSQQPSTVDDPSGGDVVSGPSETEPPATDDLESDPPPEIPVPTDELESGGPAEDNQTPSEDTPTNESPTDETPTDETPTDEEPASDEGCERDGILVRAAERLFDRLDTNDDGVISESEVGERLWEKLSSADADEDGGVSLEEIVEAGLRLARGHGHADRPRRDLFERFDTDGNGELTLEEVGDVLWEKISVADADGNGQVTVEELAEHLTSKAVEKFFDTFDDNGDDLIVESELPAVLWERLSEADTDGEPGLSPTELEEVVDELRQRLPKLSDVVERIGRPHGRIGQMMARFRGR